jgi:DNA-binding GntR family transcriptional regulator
MAMRDELPADPPASGFAAPRTRAEAVAHHLRQLILSGELAPGTKLRQTEVAKRLNVSTTPVREAFRSLAQDGIVRQDAHRGVEVFRPTTGGIRENYEIRLALEPLATAIAAESALMTDALLEELEAIQGEMDRATTTDASTACNRRFHLSIYRAAARPDLFAMIDQLRHAADAYVLLLGAWTPPGYREAVLDEHRAVLAGLHARSATQAREAMNAHLAHNFEAISAVIAARETREQHPPDTGGNR